MSFFNYQATAVWFTDDRIWIKLDNGQTASELLTRFPILAKASPEQRLKFELINGYALQWPALDEDLSVADFFDTDREKHTQRSIEKTL